MPNDLLADCRHALQQQRQALLDQIHAQRGGEIGRAQATAQARDELKDDPRTSGTDLDLSIALEERELAALNDIEAALQRLETGEFGVCGDCGQDIAPQRLRAAPAALRCIGCQSAFEKAHPQQQFPSL